MALLSQARVIAGFVVFFLILGKTSSASAQATDAEYNAIIQAFQTVRNSTGWVVRELAEGGINQTYTNINSGVYNDETFDDVESTFGPRIQASTARYDFHRGLDLDGSIGDSIVLPYDGTFIKYEFLSGTAGYTMVFRHALPPKPGGGNYTFNGANNGNLPIQYFYIYYMHLDDALTQEVINAARQTNSNAFTSGWAATKGTLIAKMGDSGSSGGAPYAGHLHLEVRLGTQNSLEFQLANPVTQYGFDPHLNPFLIFKPVPGTVMELGTLRAPTATTEGRVLFSTNQNQPMLNRIHVQITDTNTNQVMKEHTLNFNRRTGFDPTSNAALDTQDKTNPYIEPLPFGDKSVLYKSEIRLPSSWGLFGDNYAWRVTAADTWGQTVVLDVPMTALEASPTVALSAGSTASSYEYPLIAGHLTLDCSAPVAHALTVRYSLSGSALNGIDYQALNGTAMVVQGASKGRIVVTPIADELAEGDERVTVSLLATLLQDWRFLDPNGTTLNNSANSVTGGSKFNASIAGSSVYDTRFRLQRNNSGTSDAYATIATVSSGKLWVVAEFGGWTLSGTANETVTASFTSAANTTSEVAGLRLSRTSRDTIRLSGIVNGTGATPINATTVSRTDLTADILTVVLQLDLSARQYEIFYKINNGGSYTSIGVGAVAAGVSATHVRFGTTGAISSNEFIDLNRIYVSNIDPKPDGSTYLLTGTTSASLILHDRDTLQAAAQQNGSEYPLSNGSFTLTRSGGTAAAADAYFIMSGGATEGADYESISKPVRFSGGQTQLGVYVQPIADGIAEGDETVVLSLPANNNNVWQDWQFSDPNGTTLDAAANAVIGGASWNTDIAQSSVQNGSFRIRRAGTAGSAANSWAFIGSLLASGNHWLRVDVAGWNFAGTANEIVRVGFTNSTTTNNTAIMALIRTDAGLNLSGEAGGTGATQIPALILAQGAVSPEPVSLLLNLNMDTKTYRIFYKLASASSYSVLGTGNVSSAADRVPAYVRLGALNRFSDTGEFFDIDRISLVNMIWSGTPSTAQILIKDRPYDRWRWEKFTAAELADVNVSGDLADFDGDGHNTFQEYALGTEPRVADSAGAITSGDIQIGADRFLWMSFQRRKAPTDIEYIVEAANDVTSNSWNASAVVLHSSTDTGPETERVVYRDTVPVASTSSRFMRVRIRKLP